MVHLSDNQDKLSLLTLEEQNAVREFALLLRSKYGQAIKEIILFGSKARGERQQDSDIDILIVLGRLSFEIKKAISDLAAQENIKHNVLISTIRYDAVTWENPVISQSPFGQAVRNEGIWL